MTGRTRLLCLLIVLFTACTPQPPPNDAPLPTRAVMPTVMGELRVLEPQMGEFLSAEQVDVWQFLGQAGEQARIRVVMNNALPELTLLLQGEVIARGNNLIVTLPTTDVYEVQVRLAQGNPTSYEIGLRYDEQVSPTEPTNTPVRQVVGVPTPTTAFSSLGTFIQQLNETTEISGVLTSGSPRQIYTIAGEANEVLTFELRRIGGTLDPVLRFYSPEGDMLAMDDDSLGDVNARLLNVILPTTGLYSVQVTGKDFFGDYVLYFLRGGISPRTAQLPTLTPTLVPTLATPELRPAPSDSRLVNHVPVLAEIDREGGFQRFSFTAQQGDVVTLKAEPVGGSALIPEIQVFNPDGLLLETLPSSRASIAGLNGAAVVGALSIGQTGTFVLIITGENNTAGAYTIGYGRGGSMRDNYKGEPTENSTAGGNLQVATRDLWRIPLQVGDAVSLAVSPNTPAVDPVIELVTSEGVVAYRDDNSGANNAALIRLAEIRQPAVYFLRVYDANGTGTGDYTLLWRYVTLAATSTPRPNTVPILTVNGSVSDNQYQFYRFQGQVGQELRIQVEAADTSLLDPVMAVLDPQGAVIAEADDTIGLNPQVDVTLAQTGTYSIRVNGYLSSGNFTLRASLVLPR